MSRARWPSVIVATFLVSLTACEHGSTAPRAVGPAGTYMMTAVRGRGPATGIVTLSATGDADRRVRYQLNTGTLSSEYVARGTFQLRSDGTVDLQLREDDGQSTYVWRPSAEWHDGVLSISYPDPADGPAIVETYQRE